MTDTEVWWQWFWYGWVPVRVLERMLGAPGSVAEPTRESRKKSERCLGFYGYLFWGLQALSGSPWIYMSNWLSSTANIIRGLLLNITPESYEGSSCSTLYFVPRYLMETKEKARDSNINPGTLKKQPNSEIEKYQSTCCRCHPLHRTSPQVQWKQRHTIHQ